MATMEVKRHNKRVLASLRKGDLVEISRGLYSHWAVYIGGEDVIHVTGDNNRLNGHVNPTHLTSFSGECFNKAVVCINNFFDVAGTDKAKRNNNLDHKKKPLSRREIVKKALSRKGEVGYNVLMKNCQHFATWCRYGEASSDQVDFLMTTATLGAAAAVVGTLIAAAFIGDNKSKKQNH